MYFSTFELNFQMQGYPELFYSKIILRVFIKVTHQSVYTLLVSMIPEPLIVTT